ncbi:restriction endonuclease [Dictyobacter formicarum]|uniref:Type III restriction enzyme C-terminal endonuclease domain-containing protein n=1 Tax=Dictyobacter formicarum TaxID=2778368 RepID=A0ABQ3VDE0_9CHLR|nr:hypothetical protein KSZ_19860 [Dictyobacter formicarum]
MSIYDSDVEKAFVEGLEKRDDVKFYLKLPRWFMVLAPVGNYNPGWAVVIEERDAYGQSTDKPLLYLICETKGTTHLDDLRPDERRKIACGYTSRLDRLFSQHATIYRLYPLIEL